MAEDKEKARERCRRWREAHPEKAKEYSRKGSAKYRAKNPDKVKATIKAWQQTHKKEHSEYELRRRHEAFAADPKNSWAKEAVSKAKMRAREKGVPFDLSRETLPLPDVCEVLGIELVYARRGGKCAFPDSPSIDRICPERGYVQDNVRVISHRANMIKSNARPEEVELVLAYMRRHQKEGV